MRRRPAALAAMSALALALSASPAMAAGSPLMHMQGPATDVGTLCGYTFQSGYFTDVFRTADVTIGPDGSPYIPAAHVTLHDVWATDAAGAWVHVVGGEKYVDGWGLTSKIMFVSQGGGIVASINIVTRDSPHGGFIHDIGSCSFA